MQAVWRVQPANPRLADRLAQEVGIHPLTAQLLITRGVQDRAQAARFLQPSLASLDDPYRLPDMERAVSRLKRAIATREPIFIFSDSDVDGLTASVILYEVLRDLGAVVRARQSNRLVDGYGLPRPVVHRLVRSSTTLLLLVDCGTNQPEEIRLLAASGIDTIIIDHHVPLERWAAPLALINPHRADASGRPQTASFGTPVAHPADGWVPGLGRPHAARLGTSLAHPADGWVPGLGRELCSAGLALKVAHALLDGRLDERFARLLDLASLGTLADCMPLIGENRAIVSVGLPRILRTPRVGLKRLCEETRTTEPVPAHIVKRLTPRLNASGRLGDATAAWKVLLSDEDEGIEEWIAATGRAHTTTKQLHRRILAEAQEQVNRLHFRDQFVMVVSRQGWHQGLMGPLAAQLAERYGRPAIAIAMDERRGIGSGRSIPLFNLLEALRQCQGSLVRFGGHAQACGLTVQRRQLESFCALINQQARLALGREGLLKTRMVDLEVPLHACEPSWVEEAERLSPFGHGNPRPTVLIRHLTIEAISARTARLCDGATSVRGKGDFSACLPAGRQGLPAGGVPRLGSGCRPARSRMGGAGTGRVSEGRYDVIASLSLDEGELVLTVSDVRGGVAPS